MTRTCELCRDELRDDEGQVIYLKRMTGHEQDEAPSAFLCIGCALSNLELVCPCASCQFEIDEFAWRETRR